MLPRKYVYMPGLDNDNHENDALDRLRNMGAVEQRQYQQKEHVQAPEKEANLISSELDYPSEEVDPEERLHAPALDIDMPVECYESTTPGHYHLLIDRPMTWRQYKKLLKALSKAGIIEEGFYKASVNKGASFLRKKGVKKPPPNQNAPANNRHAWLNWQ